ncbi:MAG: LysR family transcriptional regulator [Oscillospiraceae bacterium]|nr:LysR family transcriptional regulator [Oscillospiraceae bacterium]
MTIQQVLYVLEAASCRSMSKASERLYVSQSAISQQILKLERELGYSLFTRSVGGLELSSEGARFCEEARSIVDDWQRFCRSVQADNPESKKQLRVGMGARVYSNGLFGDIVRFFDRRPDLEVSFVTEAGGDFLAALRRRSLDLALDVLPSEDYLARRSEYYSCELIREQQCVLMAADDPRAALPSIDVRQLQGSAVVSGLEYSAEARMLEEICRRWELSFERIYRSDGIDTNMNLVRAGRGVVFGPRSFAAHYGVAAVPLEPASSASLRFICLQHLLGRREIREFRDYMTELCEQL